MRRNALVAAACSITLFAPLLPAQAAQELSKSGRTAMARDVANSAAGKAVRLRVTKRGKVKFDATFRNSVRAGNVLAVRSSIAPKWGMLVVAAASAQGYQRTFLVKRKAAKWKALFGASRGSENLAICKVAKPATPVALDLGFSDAGLWGQRCTHRRKRSTLVRQMTAAELASIRKMVEWRWVGGVRRPGPLQPSVTDDLVSNSDCVWDGYGTIVAKAHGEVSKANPRWGAVDVGCWTGSAGYGVTQYLVRRSRRTGAFTAVPAHVLASWSSYGSICDGNRRWPVPARARVALEFCSPFPSVIRSVFR